MSSYTFTEEDVSRCKAFTRDSTNDNYATRNQRNATIIARQIYQGKLGEVAAWHYLHQDCPEVEEPDFNIYPPRKKSWKPDLSGCDAQFHVKTMGTEQAALYGLSWTFQFSSRSGKGGKDTEIFSGVAGSKSFILFVEIDTKGSLGRIHSVIHAKRLFDQDLFREPKLAHLQGIKKVVYFDDLDAAGLVGIRDHLPL